MNGLARHFSSSCRRAHGNPLGLPKSGDRVPPTMPTRGGPVTKRPIPYVKRVIAVASGKGGVGKSTIASNLAMSLAMNSVEGRQLRVGLLDLDIFGPSIPKLMGLEDADEPELTKDGRLVPLINHGIKCMSMGFLMPRSADGSSNADTAVVWRGLMVQKATQQLLFDVDWRGRSGDSGLDVLVVDMPPGTGDVALTFGQLVKTDGAAIISTPQDVALADVRKGVAMFRKVSVPILGLLLNMAYYKSPAPSASQEYIFGPTTSFYSVAKDLQTEVLGEMPIIPQISSGGDKGVPAVLNNASVQDVMNDVAKRVWAQVAAENQ